MSLHLPNKVPLLPGHQFSDPLKENFHKTQQFSVVNSTNCEKTNFFKEPIDYALLNSMSYGNPVNMTYGTRKPPENDYVPRIQPPWLKFDRKVLRFLSYFQESVVESAIENFRIRRCMVYYYLEDGTIHVTEPRTENSGLPQGLFIKRQKIPKKLGQFEEYYSWEDFNIGINMNFFERVFRIIGCDEFTKYFYDEMGLPLNFPEDPPIDNYEMQKTLKDAKINPPDTKEYKEYFEVKLGGGHPNSGLEKYLQNDRRVLSFDVVWEDNTLEGGVNSFKLNFFLADDTIEVKEIRQQNSGKDPYPLLLRRGKVPKTPILTHYPGMTLKKEEFYGPQDLFCGNRIVIYNRECLICNCDDFTRKWYRDNFGIEQQAITLKGEKPKKFYQPVPPYNGYGSEEDSLGSVFYLQPKPPKKDINKMFTCDQYILRFEARQISENKEENDKKYIVSFFCGDDTIQVYMLSERNSGIWGGKLLERKKHKNPISGKFYCEKDFQIGEVVSLGGYCFQLMRADEFTHNYMSERANVFKGASAENVINKIKKGAGNFKTYDQFLINVLRNIDKKNQGSVEFIEVANGLRELGISLSLQEIYTLMRAYDKSGQWRLNMKEFYQALGGKK